MDYDELLRDSLMADYDGTVRALVPLLREAWSEAYRSACAYRTNVYRIEFGYPMFLVDQQGELMPPGLSEDEQIAWPQDRVVACWAQTRSPEKRRSQEDGRLAGIEWSSAVRDSKEWDKGHFIGHALGGPIDGAELNVFRQRRDVNRGWSEDGKRYRRMESFAASDLGLFVFNRPFYDDDSATPSRYEFGVLRRTKSFWIETFENR